MSLLNRVFTRYSEMTRNEMANLNALHPSLVGPRRPETPPPPRLSQSQIEKLERWAREHAAEHPRDFPGKR
ncbi:hypothetical protein [Longimicrobium sp.]|uniref:hypothetical protein n=1 Tax=Longimicrobium sp. TaxID=2029185 RepID=UPI002C062A70|nr:hypothetical protein [Longimicrobium sp.]HSU13909.1 hypothetical protein [Longimicrobium sp.]